MTCTEFGDFIVSLADVLAWPLFATTAFFLLRPQLVKLFSLVETIKYKDLELSFRRTLQDAAERVESLERVNDSTVQEFLPGTLDPDPRIAILKSWAAVETAIENLARTYQHKLGKVERVSTYRRVEMLRKADLIDSSLAGVLHDMRAARNLIAHGGDIPLNTDTVQIFLRAAAHLATVVEQQFEDK